MFAPIDFVIFGGSILFSICIGIYFGFWKKSKTADEYLLGDRKMKIIPISLSIVTSHVSGVTVMALPADVYVYGANSLWACSAIICACLFSCYVYIPVIMKLKVPSVFEYLELRFDRSLRRIASFICVLQFLLFNAIISYIPAIALSQGVAIDPRVIIVVMCIICIFYTAVGGFKAVVWTDTFQFGCMVTSVLAVLVLGVILVGGVSSVYEKALRGGRLDFNFSIDPTIRDGFWQYNVGFLVVWIYYVSFHPGAVQKYLSLSNQSGIKMAVCLLCCSTVIFYMVSILIGITVYAKYSDCDPVTAGEVARFDQIVSFFVVNDAKILPGLTGIFMAGMCSASLSSLSSSLNALAAMIYSDFVVTLFPQDIVTKKEYFILRAIVVICGTVSTIVALFLDKMGTILPFSNSSVGALFGLLFGLYSLGILFPAANAKGAFCGTVISFLVTAVIAFMNQWYSLKGSIASISKPLSVEGCTTPVNITHSLSSVPSQQPFVLFRLSFFYNAVISAATVVLVGILVSCFTKTEKCVHPDLISPISLRFVRQYRPHSKSAQYVVGKDGGRDTFSFEDPV